MDVRGTGGGGGLTIDYLGTRADLLSPLTRIEAPFITAEINGYEFGLTRTNATFILGLKIEKINGAVNMYTLEIAYPVTEYNDPNFFEKLLGTISDTRTIKITYGDSLHFAYKDELAIITDVSSDMDMKSSVINYTISAVSSVSLLLSSTYNFPGKVAKPSDEIISIIQNPMYNVKSVFTGLSNSDLEEFVLRNDKAVLLPTQIGVDTLTRINTLVSCMEPVNTETSTMIGSGVYSLAYLEDPTGAYGGPFFTVKEVPLDTSTLAGITGYLLDIGAPTYNIVRDFSITDGNGWSILYKYNEENSGSNVNRIDSNGNIETVYKPNLPGVNFTAYASDKTWWSKVTKFTIQASVTIKGLIKPAMICNYLKVNVWFFGRKHISSGYYIITSLEDNISEGGYWTTLKLTKVSGDSD